MSILTFDVLQAAIDTIIATNGVGDIQANTHNPLLKDITDTLKSISSNYVTLSEDAANEYSGAPASGLDAYVEGTIVVLKFPTPSTGSVNVNLNGLGDLALKKESGGALVDVGSGDVSATVSYTVLITATAMQLLGSFSASGGDMLAANNLSDVISALTSFNNIKQAATTSATGVVELALTSEVDTGSDNTRAITPLALKDSSPTIKATNISELVDLYVVSISAIGGGLTVGTIKDSFLVRYAGTITDVSGSVETAPTDASVIVDIHKNGTTIMASDKIKIDTGEFDSKDASTQPAITTSSVGLGDKISFDVDQIGSTLPGVGGKVYVHIKRT